MNRMDQALDERLLFPFRKVETRKIFVDGYSWCTVKVLEIDESLRAHKDEAVIDALIKSPFHLWQGEQSPEGTNWVWNGKPLHVEQFGPWDRTLMTPQDYTPVLYEAAVELLLAHHREHVSEGPEELKKMEDFFREQVPADYRLFHLSLGTTNFGERRVMNSVFDHFIAFIGIDPSTERALIFEAGED